MHVYCQYKSLEILISYHLDLVWKFSIYRSCDITVARYHRRNPPRLSFRFFSRTVRVAQIFFGSLYPGKVLRFLVLEMVMEGLNWSPCLRMPESWAAMSAAGFCHIAAAAFDCDLVSTFWTTFLHAWITLPIPVLLHVKPASFITDLSCCTSLTRALILLLLAGLPQTLFKASHSQLQHLTQPPQTVACCWAFW